ncbi:MAG: ABC transporter permease [Actinomycetota bacterium]
MLLRLVRADLKIIVRNRQALFWALLFPIMFTVVFGLFRFDEVATANVAVVPSGGPAAAPVVAGLQGVDVVKVSPGIGTEAEARTALTDGEIDFALLVPDEGPVRMLFVESAADRNRIFVSVFRQVLDQVNIRIAGISPRYELVPVGVAGNTTTYYDFVLPGLVGMAVMTYGIIGIAGTIAQYRGQRILRRIRATPLSPRTFLVALGLAHLMLAVVQSGLVLATGVFLFGANVRGSILAIILFALLGNLTFINIGFMVAARAETAEAASGLGNFVAMPMMFLSGVFFPTDSLPWILPTVTSLLPLYPLVDAIRRISVDGASIMQLGSQFGQLAVWAVGSLILATRMFRFERA